MLNVDIICDYNQSDVICELYFYVLTIKCDANFYGNMDKYGVWINPQERGGSKIVAKMGSKGELPMYINSTHFFLKLLFVYEPSNFLLSVPKANPWIHAIGWVL